LVFSFQLIIGPDHTPEHLFYPLIVIIHSCDSIIPSCRSTYLIRCYRLSLSTLCISFDHPLLQDTNISLPVGCTYRIVVETRPYNFVTTVCSCTYRRRPTSLGKIPIELWAWRASWFIDTYPHCSGPATHQKFRTCGHQPPTSTRTAHTHTPHTLHQHSIMDPRSPCFCVFLSLCAASLDTTFQSALAGESFFDSFPGLYVMG
jgi:hypothetical protein